MEKSDQEEVLAELALILNGVEDACGVDSDECDQVLDLLESEIRQRRHKRLIARVWRETLTDAELLREVEGVESKVTKAVMLNIRASNVIKRERARRGYVHMITATTPGDIAAIRAHVDEYLNPTHKE